MHSLSQHIKVALIEKLDNLENTINNLLLPLFEKVTGISEGANEAEVKKRLDRLGWPVEDFIKQELGKIFADLTEAFFTNKKVKDFSGKKGIQKVLMTPRENMKSFVIVLFTDKIFYNATSERGFLSLTSGWINCSDALKITKKIRLQLKKLDQQIKISA